MSERLVHTCAGVQDAAEEGMRHMGNSRARWEDADAGGHASYPWAAWGGSGAWPDPSAVAPTSPHDWGRVGDPPGAVRRRTRRRLPGGHAPGHEGWIRGKFQMSEDLPDHLALRDGGDDPQHPPLTLGIAVGSAMLFACPWRWARSSPGWLWGDGF